MSGDGPKDAKLTCFSQHRLKLWKEGPRPSTGLMPKKASARHITSLIRTFDFKIPGVELLKDSSPFVSQNPLRISLIKAFTLPGEAGALCPQWVTVWLFNLVEPLQRHGVGGLFLKTLSSSLWGWSGQSFQCLKEMRQLSGKTYLLKLASSVILIFFLSVFTKCSLWKKEHGNSFSSS